MVNINQDKFDLIRHWLANNVQKMTRVDTPHPAPSSEEIGWSFGFFRCCSSNRLSCCDSTPSPLYLACQNGDLVDVKSCLKKMKLKEINEQYPPNNETPLHAATRNQHIEIIRILLQCGAEPSLRNSQGQQASELGESEEIKQLFKRSQPSRFAFSNSYFSIFTSMTGQINCKNCSLLSNNTMYEWELIVNQNASEKAQILRERFQVRPSINAKVWRKKLYSLNKGYLTAHSENISTAEGAFVYDCFQRALNEQDPRHLIMAYTSCQRFATLLNIDMARNVVHDLKKGCSQFSCQCLYLTEGGTKIMLNLLLHHPDFQECDFEGEVHRGIVMPKHQLDHYKVKSCIITTTFLSTSKNPVVAEVFADKSIPNANTHSFFCTYKIISKKHTAIDISSFSKHPEENEILILPYLPFLITKIVEEEERTKIYLEEHCLARLYATPQEDILRTRF